LSNSLTSTTHGTGWQRKSTSGKHHLARLVLSRAEVEASKPSVIAAMEKVKEKEEKSNILGKL